MGNTFKHNPDVEDTFNVVLFFEDGSYHYEYRRVTAHQAIAAAKRLTSNVSARMGLTRRVIITDSGDCINFEWKFGEGITFT